jgi:predicted S18 family serine protease
MVQTDIGLGDIEVKEKQLEEAQNKLKSKEKEVSRLLVSEVKNVDKIKDLTQRTWELEENYKKLGIQHEKLGLQNYEKIELINKYKAQLEEFKLEKENSKYDISPELNQLKEKVNTHEKHTQQI